MQLIMLLWSYFTVVLTDPGSVPLNWKPSVDEERGENSPLTGLELQQSGALTETGSPRVRYCRKCSQFKPPRCHHCSVCKLASSLSFSTYFKCLGHIWHCLFSFFFLQVLCSCRYPAMWTCVPFYCRLACNLSFYFKY